MTAKVAGYAGNPFGVADVLTEATHASFAAPGTVDTNHVVPVSTRGGLVGRVAKGRTRSRRALVLGRSLR